MKQNDYILSLKNTIRQLDDSLRWLERSYKICMQFGIKDTYSDDEFDAIETLTSRYARTMDLVVNRVFTSIDQVELEEIGSVLDIVNRAEKRGLIDSVANIRIMKDIRNVIVHEYVAEAILDVYKDVTAYVPEIFSICKRVKRYCAKFFKVKGKA